MTEFERFCEQVHAAMRLHGLDPARLTREDVWRSYKRGDHALELVQLHLNLQAQEAEMNRACRRR
jgi:hypothetical protein